MAQIKTVRLMDSRGRAFGIRLDASTLAFNTIDYGHHEVHAGNSFCAAIYEVDFDKADSIGILFTTPNTRTRLHLVANVYAGASALFQICEAPTLDVGEYSTTFLNPMNRDRNSSIQSGIRSWRAAPVVNQFSHKVVADAAPVTADGTVIHSEVLGSGKQGGGAASRDTGERILRQNTTYYFRLAGMAGGADNSVASMELVWYEHEANE